MKDAGDLIENIFSIAIPLQRKEKILETLEILALIFFSPKAAK